MELLQIRGIHSCPEAQMNATSPKEQASVAATFKHVHELKLKRVDIKILFYAPLLDLIQQGCQLLQHTALSSGALVLPTLAGLYCPVLITSASFLGQPVGVSPEWWWC